MLRLVVFFAMMMVPAMALAGPDEQASDAEALFGRLHLEDQDLAGDWEDTLRLHLTALEAESEDAQTLAAIQQIETLIALDRLAFDISELEGEWRMRSLQTDPLGAYAYQFFAGRIYREARALVFDKPTGSQRHQGYLGQLDDETVFFVGALYYGYQEPRLYSTMMAGEITEQIRAYDAVAEIYKIGPDRFLMAFAPQDGQRFRFYDIRR